MEQVESHDDRESTFAKRLITGQAAEDYFKANYTKIDEFKNYRIEDTTRLGCGFDFKLQINNKEFLGIEIKGLHHSSGTITLTNKEYSVAKLLRERYFLFIVKDFRQEPFHDCFENPLHSKLNFSRIETTIKQISWNVSV